MYDFKISFRGGKNNSNLCIFSFITCVSSASLTSEIISGVFKLKRQGGAWAKTPVKEDIFVLFCFVCGNGQNGQDIRGHAALG